jgi:ferredoxin
VRCIFMDPMQITDQIFKARQASWDRMFYNAQEEDAEELVDDGQAAPVGKAVTGKTPAPAPAGDIATPTAQAPAPTAAPGGTKDPAAPVDTVTNFPPAAQGDIGNILADVMLDADSGGGRGGIKNEKVMELLAAKGVQTRAADVDGKKGFEILDNSGNVVAKMHDNNGDGAVGMEDESVVKALHDLGADTAKMDQLVQDRIGHYSKSGKNKEDIIHKNMQKAKEGAPAAAGTDKAAAPAASQAATVQAVDAAVLAEEQTAPQDPAYKIGAAIVSGDQQAKPDGSAYKYQVKDCNLSSCPRGKPACTGCGQCIKAELFKIQKAGGSIEAAADGLKGAGQQAVAETPAAETAPAASASAPQQTAAEQQVIEQPVVAEASRHAKKPKAEVQSAEEALKQVQAYLDSYGFADKTAEELLADGQLDQIALQLGIQLPENLYK